MGTFHRDRLPPILDYCETAGLTMIQAKGKWRSTRCDFCGASKAMRINTESGGWCCMSCGEKGGDSLTLHMALTGADFITSARLLGAWSDDGQAFSGSKRPRSLPAADALELLYQDSTLVWVAAQNIAQGITLTAADIADLTAAAKRVMMVSQKSRS